MYLELILCVLRINFVCTSNLFCVFFPISPCIRAFATCHSNYKVGVPSHGRFSGNLRSVINLLISEHEFETEVLLLLLLLLLLQTRHRLLDASGTANSVITADIPSFSLEEPVRNLKCSLTEFISSLYDLLEVAYSVPNSVHSQDEVLNATR